MALFAGTERLDMPLHPTSSSMTYSEYMARHRIRTSPKQPRQHRFDPAPGDSPHVVFPDCVEEAFDIKYSLPPGHEDYERPIYRREPKPSTSRAAPTSPKWISHSATEARPRPLKSALKKPKRKSEFDLATILWEINRPRPRGKRVTFAPDVKKGDDDSTGKVVNPKLFKCISPPWKVYPPTPGRSVDEVLADISYDYADLCRGKRFSTYAFDPEVRLYLISRMKAARERVALACELEEIERRINTMFIV